MQLNRRAAVWPLTALLAGSIGSSIPAAIADEPCMGFKWDVAKERALFTSPGVSLAAGKDQASAPAVEPNHLYQLQLAPQALVAFAVAPGKHPAAEGAYAGLVTLRIAAPGSYRIAADIPFWIDVVSSGALLRAKDFEGQHGCNAPHKIVEFDLNGVRPFILQFSESASSAVRVTITASPPRKQ
jgi:hypothetical protein